MEGSKMYTVFKAAIGHEYEPGRGAGDIASFPDKTTAIQFCKEIAGKSMQLRSMGVQFSGNFDYQVRATIFAGDGRIYHRAVILDDAPTDEVEYETEPPALLQGTQTDSTS